MAVRLNVNLNEDVAQALKELADKRGLTATETIRRAIAWYKFIDDEVVERGRKIQVLDPATDRVSEVAIVG